MSKKFEKLLEYVVNNETDKAQALFHDIVVGKSREIYENLIASEAEHGVGGSEVDSFMDDITAEENDISEEGEEEFDGEEHLDEPAMELPPEGGEEMGHEMDVPGEGGIEDMEDRLVDLEDALKQLQAEFDEKVVNGDESEDGVEAGDEEVAGDEELGSDDSEEGDEFSDEDSEESEDDELSEAEEDDEEDDEEELDEAILEYTENVGKPYGSGKGISNKSEDSGTNKTSPVAKNAKSPVGGEPIKVKDGSEGNHGVKAPGKLSSIDGTKGEGTKMKKVQDMKKV